MATPAEPPDPTYDELAAQLVRRGLASAHILDSATRPSWPTEDSPSRRSA